MCIHHPRQKHSAAGRQMSGVYLKFSISIPLTILKAVGTQWWQCYPAPACVAASWLQPSHSLCTQCLKTRGNVASTSSFGNPPRMEPGEQKDKVSDFLSVAGYDNGACLLPVCRMAEASGPPHFRIYICCVGHIQVAAPSVVMFICFREFNWH